MKVARWTLTGLALFCSCLSMTLAWQPRPLVIGAAACPMEAAPGQEVALLGTASPSSGASFAWTQSGVSEDEEPVDIIDADTSSASFVAPGQEGSLFFELRVTNGDGQTATDQVEVSVSNEAGAGEDTGMTSGTATGIRECNQLFNSPAVATVPATLTISAGNRVTIFPEAAQDPDNTAGQVGSIQVSGVNYRWSVLDGAGLISDEDLVGSDSSTVSFFTPQLSEQKTIVLSLLVYDVAACGTRYPVQVEVLPGFGMASCTARQPVAVATVRGVPNGTRFLRNRDHFILDAASSLLPLSPAGDENVTPSYSWRQIGGPAAFLSGIEREQLAGFVSGVDEDESLEFRLLIQQGTFRDEQVVSVPVVPGFELFFPQFAFGPIGSLLEFVTTPVLINDNADAAEVSIEFYDQSGASISPLLEGVPWTPESTIEIPANSARQLEFTPASEEELSVGWARVSSDSPLTGLVLYRVIDHDSGEILEEVSLFASSPGSIFTTLFDRTNGPAIAVANPGNEPATVIVDLLREDAGSLETVVSRSIVLPSRSQQATFLDVGFFGSFPPDLERATLSVREQADRSIIATVLKTDTQGIARSTLPFASRSSDAGFLVPNQPPTPRLTYRVDLGEPVTVEQDTIIEISAPATVLLDAGPASDDGGVANLTTSFDVVQDISAGGAILTRLSELERSLEISEGTVGTIEVRLNVADSAGLTSSLTLTVELPEADASP